MYTARNQNMLTGSLRAPNRSSQYIQYLGNQLPTAVHSILWSIWVSPGTYSPVSWLSLFPTFATVLFLLDEDWELWFRSVGLAHKLPKSGDNCHWALNWSRGCKVFVRGRGKSVRERNRWRMVVHYISCMVSLGERRWTSETFACIFLGTW